MRTVLLRWLAIGFVLLIVLVLVDWWLSPAAYEPPSRLFAGPFFAAADWFFRKPALVGLGTLGLLAVTAALAFFTFHLWRETGDLVIGSQQTAMRQLRAYVGVETLSNDTSSLTIRFKNFGHTPAHHVTLVYTPSWAAHEASYRHPASKEGEPLANQMIMPGQGFNYEIQIPNAEEVIQLGIGQELPFYIYGRIDYMDVYKNWRATYFCQLYNAGMPRGARSSPHYYHNYEYPPP